VRARRGTFLEQILELGLVDRLVDRGAGSDLLFGASARSDAAIASSDRCSPTSAFPRRSKASATNGSSSPSSRPISCSHVSSASSKAPASIARRPASARYVAVR
jgi:hypothetical protein